MNGLEAGVPGSFASDVEVESAGWIKYELHRKPHSCCPISVACVEQVDNSKRERSRVNSPNIEHFLRVNRRRRRSSQGDTLILPWHRVTVLKNIVCFYSPISINSLSENTFRFTPFLKEDSLCTKSQTLQLFISRTMKGAMRSSRSCDFSKSPCMTGGKMSYWVDAVRFCCSCSYNLLMGFKTCTMSDTLYP